MPSSGRGVQVVLAWTERDADPPMGGIRLNSGDLERVWTLLIKPFYPSLTAGG
jgi:hypothetical protein